ncbi:MAG: Asp-tRNA(Asn)/Glu-tRNA(Gln) amidotransferase subunit GatC [Candidatus Krumholzibacteriota bacterium]|nr:Asp-tRNA(Asn)/Glu-tRNA(Gln) amidotransferase subunit GatC [Candidatus Krumholzibacteriota bacterium]
MLSSVKLKRERKEKLKMLSDDEIKHIEKLARIRLGDEDREKLKGQLSDIIEFVRVLQKIDTSGFETVEHIARFKPILREGGAGGELEREKVLEQAPDRENGFFKVPPVINKK